MTVITFAPSHLFLLIIAGGALFFASLYFGCAPRSIYSLAAYVLHFFLGSERPFQITKLAKGLYIGVLPKTQDHLKQLRDMGVTKIVTLLEPHELKITSSELKSFGFQHIELHVPDYSSPTLKEVQKAVTFIENGKQVEAGVSLNEQDLEKREHRDIVFIHCKGGRGRSAVVAIALLMKRNRWSPQRSYGYVLSKKNIANLKGPFGLRKHWRVLSEWEKLIMKSSNFSRQQSKTDKEL
jgi:atypical dual specificity phosphatase